MRRSIPLAAAAAAISLLPPAAVAQTAGHLSFQAQLKDNGGVFSGVVDIEFRIYDADTGGNLQDLDGNGMIEDVFGKDAQKFVGVQVTDSLLQTKWGPVSPKLFDGTPRWVEVRVDSEILDRFEIVQPPAIAEQLNAPGSGEVVASTTADGNLGIGAETAIAKLDLVGNTPVAGDGFVSSTPGLTSVTGGGTTFLSDLQVGDLLIAGAQKRMVVSILSDTSLSVESPFDPELMSDTYTFQQPIARLIGSGGSRALTVAGDGRVAIGQTLAKPGVALTVFGGADLVGALDVSGTADVLEIVGPWEQGGTSEGYVRLGDVQICWGRYFSDAPGGAITFFPAPFKDAGSYRVTGTCADNVGTRRFAQLINRWDNRMQMQTYHSDGSGQGSDGDYLAIGLWR